MRTVDTIKMEENKTIAELEQNTLSNLVAGFEFKNPEIADELARTNLQIAEILKEWSFISSEVAWEAIKTSWTVDKILSMWKEEQTTMQLANMLWVKEFNKRMLAILEKDKADDYKYANVV